MGIPGEVPILKSPAPWRSYTIKMDDDGNGGLHTMFMVNGGNMPVHLASTVSVKTCPSTGCWPAPRPPAQKEAPVFSKWSQKETWYNTTDSMLNPLNKLAIDMGKSRLGKTVYKVVEQQKWTAATPSDSENVWIPQWRKIVLDVSTPVLGRLVIEGTLIINASSRVNLTATYIEIKGGVFIIATCDALGNVIGAFEGLATITMLGTNPTLAAIHGSDPRETPKLTLGSNALLLGPAVIGVMGTFIAKGKPVTHAYVPLNATAEKAATSVQVEQNIGWLPGNEIVITPTDYDMHEAEVRTITAVTRTAKGKILKKRASCSSFKKYRNEQSVELTSERAFSQASASFTLESP